MAAVASWPLFFSLLMSSEALFRRAFMVSASVMAWRRWVSTSRKSLSTAAGSAPRWRSISSTRGRLSRTKFRSSMGTNYFIGNGAENARAGRQLPMWGQPPRLPALRYEGSTERSEAASLLSPKPLACVNYLRDEILPPTDGCVSLSSAASRPDPLFRSPDLRFRLQRPSQTGSGDHHRPVPRRLPGALPRPVRRRRIPSPPRSRRKLHQLQLRLRQHAHRPWPRHAVHGRL